MTDVPCNGCTLCCRNDVIVLHPEHGDDPTLYRTEPAVHPFTGEPVLVLQRKADGTCIYLGSTGCTIHAWAPVICREFDCRNMYRSQTRAQRRRNVRNGFATQAIYDRGRELLEQGR